jgi:hypothetical protein
MRFCASTYYKIGSLIMKIQLAAIGIVAAFTFAACETTPTTPANRASNNSNTATVVNSNSTGANANSMSPITTTNSNSTTTNSNRSSLNYNGTAKENEASRASVESQAKAAGSNIGQGAEDWWLWSKTNAALTSDANLHSSSGMNVDVVNSVITLRGTVPTQADVAEANKIAKSITGQKGVVNKLTVSATGSSTGANSNTKAGSH